MRANFARIGNSGDVRIPEPLIEASGIMDEVELAVEDRRLTITPVPHPRAGWEEAFAAHPTPDDGVFGDDLRDRFDDEEWAW